MNIVFHSETSDLAREINFYFRPVYAQAFTNKGCISVFEYKDGLVGFHEEYCETPESIRLLPFSSNEHPDYPNGMSVIYEDGEYRCWHEYRKVKVASRRSRTGFTFDRHCHLIPESYFEGTEIQERNDGSIWIVNGQQRNNCQAIFSDGINFSSMIKNEGYILYPELFCKKNLLFKLPAQFEGGNLLFEFLSDPARSAMSI